MHGIGQPSSAAPQLSRVQTVAWAALYEWQTSLQTHCHRPAGQQRLAGTLLLLGTYTKYGTLLPRQLIK